MVLWHGLSAFTAISCTSKGIWKGKGIEIGKGKGIYPAPVK
jgi:hypothetical protein